MPPSNGRARDVVEQPLVGDVVQTGARVLPRDASSARGRPDLARARTDPDARRRPEVPCVGVVGMHL